MGQEITIGRAYSNLLRLEGEEISRVHAIIYRRGNDYVLRDLDSKNGVYLNGERIATSLVASGDEMRIGNFVLLFDPDPEFDITGFLRQHNVRPITDTGSASAEDPDTSGMPDDESFTYVVGSQDQVFFTLADIDKLADPRQLASSSQFVAEIINLLNRLGNMQTAEESDEAAAVYQHLLNCLVEAIGAERGVIVLRDEARDKLRLGAIIPPDRDIAVNRVVLRCALREQQAVLCNDPTHDSRFQETDTVQRERIGSLIAYPVIRGENAAGLIYADVRERTNVFRREHLVLLQFVSRILLMWLQRVTVRH